MKIQTFGLENLHLKNLLNNKNAKIHLIGIGGISMSAIAEILLKNGYFVTGSDAVESEFTKKISDLGGEVKIGHSFLNIENQDIVCYSAAIDENNPEIIAAREKNVPIIERCVFLGEIIKSYKNTVAVAGTHGKTTVTSMITSIFIAAGLCPNVLIGGKFPKINSNCLISNNNEFLILEACEYVDSFLNFASKIAVITNIEEDHLDYYKNLEHIINSFIKFSNLSSETLVINNDDENCKKVLKTFDKNLVTFGMSEDSNFFAKNIKFGNSKTSFTVFQNIKGKGEKYVDIEFGLLGIHNVYNVLAALAASFSAKIEPQFIKRGIEEFSGVKRRFEKIGTIGGISIIDDYAHHPTEIKATLASAKLMGYKKIWCVFQSHTYTRTAALFNQFAKSLGGADEIIIIDTYAARETNNTGISAKDLAKAAPNCIYIKEFEDVVKYLIQNVKKGELVITMGAGTVTDISTMLYESLKLRY